MMTPLDYYDEQCKKGLIFQDSQQLLALKSLQRTYFAVLEENKQRSRWSSWLRSPRLVQGVYLWGGVGIGKTLLMDCFFKCLPFSKKRRQHFHQFMQGVHNDLARLQGKKDPLSFVASEIADQVEVLCFDELFVSDITDAMLLGRLVRLLFEKKVCIVATSNTEPNDLYKHGLQRSQFIPAIDAVNKNMEIIHISTTVDYRLRHLKEAGVFYTPLNQAAADNMEKTFSILAENHPVFNTPITLYGREVAVYKRTDTIVWFNFNVICAVPRSQKDFLAIAETYQTVFISNIPVIPADAKDTICLFISLVDVFYDAGVRLAFSAAEPVSDIYSRGYMTLEYTRTNSRLLEMQSMDYFAGEETKRNSAT